MMFLCLAVVLSAIAFCFMKRKLSYWKRKKIPYVGESSIWSNINTTLRPKHYHGLVYEGVYNKFKRNGEKHGGFYNMLSPCYMPLDTEIIRLILEKNFDHFYIRGFYYNEKDDPLSAHLFAIEGQKWKTLRSKLTPVFTRAKIKPMLEVMTQCAVQLKTAIDELISKDQVIDVKDTMSRFTVDTISSTALGMECNTFLDKDSKFYEDVYDTFHTFTSTRWLLLVIGTHFPHLARTLGIKMLKDKASKLFLHIARSIFDYRKANNFRRNDAFQALIDLGDALTVQEIGAQCVVFLIAGFDTSSSTLTYALYELSRHHDIQNKARQEILRVLSKYNGDITYEALEEMHYVQQIIDETLRLYPPVPSLTRRCTKSFKFPNCDYTMEEGTDILISILGLHHDKEYYPDPKKFDPERFSEDNKKKIKPYTYMPFGEGPRVCIGKRFAMIEIKLALSTLLKNYAFEFARETVDPISFRVYGLTMLSKDPIFLAVKILHNIG